MSEVEKPEAPDLEIGEPQEPEAVEYPEYIPEKYRNGSIEEAHAAMGKGYTELESLLGKPKDETPAEPEPEPEPQFRMFESEDELLASVELTKEQIAQEWETNGGSLNPDTYEKFQAQGAPRWMVDKQIQAEKVQTQARVEAFASAAFDAAGGEQEFESLRAWARRDSYAGQAAGEFDKALASGTPDQVRDAVAKLKAEHAASIGADKSRPLVDGDGAPPAGGGFFPNWKEKAAAARAVQNGTMTMAEYSRRLRLTQEHNPSAMDAPKSNTVYH